MQAFQFDESKTFTENCRNFIDALRSDDPEMAAILEENWSGLMNIVSEGERDAGARREFYSLVKSSLDALIESSKVGEGK